MAYINTATEGGFVRVDIVYDDGTTFADAATAFASTKDVLNVPALQDITINASPNTFRWSQLDSLSEFVVTTRSTNSISTTMVLDDTTFFRGTLDVTPVAGVTEGLFDIINKKQRVFFRVYWAGSTTGDRYVQGRGFLASLAPTVSTDSPVWTSPVTIEVTGDYEQGTVA